MRRFVFTLSDEDAEALQTLVEAQEPACRVNARLLAACGDQHAERFAARGDQWERIAATLHYGTTTWTRDELDRRLMAFWESEVYYDGFNPDPDIYIALARDLAEALGLPDEEITDAD
jgi:hypothetical protein